MTLRDVPCWATAAGGVSRTCRCVAPQESRIKMHLTPFNGHLSLATDSQEICSTSPLLQI